MKHSLCWAVLLAGILPASAATPLAQPLVTGLKNPACVAVGPDGRVYVSTGECARDGEGKILVIENGKATPFAVGMNDPRGMVTWMGKFWVVDKTTLWRIFDLTGKIVEVSVTAANFPGALRQLHDIEVDEGGTFYVTDAGDGTGKGAAVYRINPRREVERVLDRKRYPRLQRPGRVLMDGATHLLLADSDAGTISRVTMATGAVVKLAGGFSSVTGMTWDKYGRFFFTDGKDGKVFVIPRPGAKPRLLAEGLQGIGDCCVEPSGKFLLVVNTKAGTLLAIPAVVPGAPVDDTPLFLEPAVAFPNLKWAGWQPEDDAGRPAPLRPVVLTHAGDSSNRVFVATQHGVVHVFPSDKRACQTQVFLDIQERVQCREHENEEGLIGLAFHPQFKKNGEFFAFYTPKKEKLASYPQPNKNGGYCAFPTPREEKLVNILARFRCRPGDAGKADPSSEEVLLWIERPYWNHDGGTICFGPDGCLYVTLGDGGSTTDPYGNGQNLATVLGKILRIDVDRREGGKGYAVPADNPFVSRPGARPEIWAYGLRNTWRIAFDRDTGQLWGTDVGQNLYEEINLIVRGGNYGWNLREGLHPFGARGVSQREDLIDPIWEYHHDVGKSIIGGFIYRGERLPELKGSYVYGDYITGRMWALRYDDKKKRVVANRPLRDKAIAIMSFGEDEKGEIYFLTTSITGQGIYGLVPVTPKGP